MSYNLVENSNFYATTSGVGNVSLKVSEVVSISELSGTTTLSGSDILQLECDFGSRIKIDEIRYYFSSASSSGTVSSSIDFYYKDDAPDAYTSISTNIGAGYYYAIVPGLSAPRYVRLIHTISGTSVDGTVVGFNILNEDDTVDFGPAGTADSFSISSSVLGGSAEIRTAPVYNSGTLKATAYVTLDPQGTNVDKLITISTTSGGPWYGVSEGAQIIADEDSWSTSGNFSNSEVGSGMLQLTPIYSSGTYTTKVFDSSSKNSFVYLDIHSEPGGSFITKDENKEVRTIEIRSSGQKPKDYAACRVFSYEVYDGRKRLYYEDKHRDGGDLIYKSGYLAYSHESYDSYVSCSEADDYTGNTAGLSYRTSVSPNYRQLRAFIIDDVGEYSDVLWLQRDSTSAIDHSCYHIRWDESGGTWWFIYTNYSRDGYVLNQGTGYYLMHFNSGVATNTYKGRFTSNMCWDMSCEKTNGWLWYVDRNTGFVRLITKTGEELVQRSDSNAYGISARSDGGCWYVSINTNEGVGDLIHLDVDGNLIEILEGVGTSSLRRVLVSSDGTLYIRDGEYIKRISTDGAEIFSVYLSQADILLRTTDTGVWVRTSDDRVRFVSSGGELKSTDIEYSYLPAIMEFYYNTQGYEFNFPIPSDNHWHNLRWSEVRPDKYPIPIGDEYVQARVTLRSNEPFEIYDVDEDDVWTPEDYFTQTSGTLPKEHRWWTGSSSDALSIVNNTLRFYGDVPGTKSIVSSDASISDRQRWYIDTLGTENIDIRLYYRLPGAWNPPPTTYSLYLRLYSLDDTHLGHYAEALMQRSNNGGVGYNYLRMLVNDGTSHQTAASYVSSYDYGYLRLRLDWSSGVWRALDYINGTWEYKDLSLSSYPLGNKFYVYIAAADHGAGNNIDIHDFTFISGIDNVIFYDWQSPKLQNIYLQKSIEIPNIYPNTAKNAYMKLEVPSTDMSWAGSYNTSLKAWWEVST